MSSTWPHWVCIAGLLIGAGMGLYAMVRPAWASWLVRLKADPERPGGYAEFRGTYGGLFFFTHALPLAFFLLAIVQPGATGEPMAALFIAMCSVCVAAWWGTALGRIVSILVDRQGLPFNWGSVGFEVALGLLISAPGLAALSSGH